MDKETFGVELDLILDKFNKKMDSIDDAFEKIKSKFEFEVDPKMGVNQLQTELLKAQRELQKFKGYELTNKEDVETVAKLQVAVETLQNRIRKLGATPFKLKEKVEELNEELEETDEGFKIVNKTSIKFSNNLGQALTRSIKSLKRFTLSLFGIQSIWSLLSRATHTYMSQNEALSNKIQSVWNGLGAMVAPVVDYLADVFMKLLGYINVVTKALFNFDIIAKANETTMKNYNKQLAKSQKQLSSFDELQNIQQQQEGPKGLINEDDIKLDDGLVKKLQDVSFWLKDNWDWLGKVLIALGLVFGVSAVAGWVKNIGKLLGIAGTSGIGGSGLIGLATTLGWIAGLGILAVEIYIAYKYAEDLFNTEDFKNKVRKDQKKLHNDYINIADDKKEEAKSYKKGSKEIATYIGMLESNVEMNLANIESGKLTVEQMEENIDELEKNIDAYRDLYNQGQLTEEQTKDYIEYMKKVDDIVSKVQDETYKYSDELKKYTINQKNANGTMNDTISKLDTTKTKIDNLRDKMKTYKDVVNDTTGAMSIGASTGSGALSGIGIVIDKIKDKAVIMGSAISNAVSGPYTITINSNLNPPDTTAYINAINDVIRRLNNNDAARMVATGSAIGSLTTMALNRIPYLSVGTDLVKSEGLAYLHAGEQVVPADVASGGYSNNDDTNSLLRELIETVQQKEFIGKISSDEVGKASVSYIKNQNRIMGGSVI